MRKGPESTAASLPQPDAGTAEQFTISGYLDQLTEDLIIPGWAWYPSMPERRVDLEILLNGRAVAKAAAISFRQDVLEAGKGDGRYGFRAALSPAALTRVEEIIITAREAVSGRMLVNELRYAPDELAKILINYARQAKGDGRLEALRAAMRLEPEKPWHIMALTDALREAGRNDEAAKLLRQLIAARPQFWHARVGLGLLARANGERAQALEFFTEAANLAPADVWRWLDVAEELRALGRIAEAKDALHKAEKAEPGFWAVELGLGYCARAVGEHAAARAYFETAARLAPEQLAPRIGLLEELRDSGDLTEARQQGETLLAEHPTHLPLLLHLAYTARQSDETAEAARWFTQALALEPQNPALLTELARQEYQLGGQERSNEYLAKALSINPGQVDAIAQLASQALTVGDAAQAFEIYQDAAQHQPAELTFRFGMLDTLAWQGRIQEALSGLQALELEHGVTPQLQIWRITLLRRTGQMDEALRTARAATMAAPEQFWLWIERFQTELLAGSDSMLQKCLFNIPGTTQAERAIRQRCVGALAESLWQLDAALRHYEAAATLEQNDIALQEALARVKLMRLDINGARTHLRKQYELMAAERRLRGESPNISQSLLGQMIEEYALDDDLAARLAALNALPAFDRLAPLALMVCGTPDATAPAASLLLALRQAEMLNFIPQGEGAAQIPQRLTMFWDKDELPPDLGGYVQSWRSLNPSYEFQLFNDDAARAYLSAKFPGPVMQAYLRVREATQKADIFRLALLVAEGGVYADIDDRCLRPLEMFLPSGASLVLAQEDFGCAANHFLAAAPGHPVLQGALRAVVTAVNRGDNEIPWLLSGPALITRALAQHLAARGISAELPPGLAVLDKRTLGQNVASRCFAAYKNYQMRNRRRIDAAASHKLSSANRQ